MNKFKRFFNGRLVYSLAVGILAVGVAATGAMLLGGEEGPAEEGPYLALEESPEQIVYGTTEAVLPTEEGPELSQTEPEEQEEPEETPARPDRPVRGEEPVDAEPETPEPEETDAEETEAPAEAQEPETEADPAEAAAPVFSEESTLDWPLHGSILREFSMDTTVFYPTLEAYKVSPGILIQGEPGQEVCAAAPGVVQSIGSNEEIGQYMVVDLGGGYQATYGQLEAIRAAEGDTVETGQSLAVLAEPTKYYVVEGCNLYFQVTKDGSPVDPLDYLHQ